MDELDNVKNQKYVVLAREDGIKTLYEYNIWLGGFIAGYKQGHYDSSGEKIGESNET